MPMIRRYLPYAVMLAFAAWCVISFSGDLAQLPLSSLARSWDLVLLAATLSLLNYVLRIIRWRMYLRQLGYLLPFRFAALTFAAGFAYTLSPGKLGEMVRARYYVPLGVPMSAVGAAFFCERFLDLVAMVALAALLFSTASGYSGTISAAAVGSAVILVAVAALPWAQLSARLREGHAPGKLRRVASQVTNTLASARALLSPGMLTMGFVLGLTAWALEGVGLSILSSMFRAPHLNLTTAVGIYGVAVLIGGLSFLPGGLGSTEAVMTALLAANGYSVGEALLITLTCRLVTLWLAVIVGWAAVLILRQRSFAQVTPCN